MEKQNNSELYREWLAKIRSSEKNYEDYYALVEEIRKYTAMSENAISKAFFGHR